MGERREQHVGRLGPEVSKQGHEALGDPADTEVDKSQRAWCLPDFLASGISHNEIDLKTRLRETEGEPFEHFLGTAPRKMWNEQSHSAGPSRSDGHVGAH